MKPLSPFHREQLATQAAYDQYLTVAVDRVEGIGPDAAFQLAIEEADKLTRLTQTEPNSRQTFLTRMTVLGIFTAITAADQRALEDEQ